MITLAAETWFVAAPKIPEGEGPEWGKAAPIGLLVIVLLCIAVWLLLRSMSKHMRIVRERFPEERRGFYLDGSGGSPDNPDDADQTDGPREAGPADEGPTDADPDAAPNAAPDVILHKD